MLSQYFHDYNLTILAPRSFWHIIQSYLTDCSIPVSLISEFTSHDQVTKLLSDIDIGILPYPQPPSNDSKRIRLSSCVMSTKLSDYICLRILPMIPTWCSSACETLNSLDTGIVYDYNYSINPFKLTYSSLLSNFSNLISASSQFTASMQRTLLEFHVLILTKVRCINKSAEYNLAMYVVLQSSYIFLVYLLLILSTCITLLIRLFVNLSVIVFK